MTRFDYNLPDHVQFAEAINRHMPSRRRGAASAVPGGTTFIVSNFPAIAGALVINVGANGVAAANTDVAAGSFIQSITGNVSGDSFKIVTATAATRRHWSPWIRFHFSLQPGASANRIWVGAFSAEPSAVAAGGLGSVGSLSGACFSYDAAVHATAFWRCESANGTAQQVTTTDMDVTTNILYTGELRMDNALGKVDFYMASHGINTASKVQQPLRLVASHATAVPADSTALLLGATVTTQAAAAKRFNMGYITINQD
jgi:hypothetical protein